MTVTTNYLVTGNGITGSTANAVQALVSGAGVVAKFSDSTGDFLLRPDGGAVAVGSYLGAYTWAVRPDATLAAANSRWLCTDWRCEFIRNAAGTGWELMGPAHLLLDLAAPVTGSLSASEQILKQYTIPAGLLASLRYFSVNALWSAAGTTDTATVRLKLGLTGTTADNQIMSSGNMTAANGVFATESMFFASSATQLRLLTGSNATGFGASASSISSFSPPQNIGISDSGANALILSATAQMAGATDAPTLSHLIIVGY